MTAHTRRVAGAADVDRWLAAWPEALALWGRGLRLQAPVLLTDPPREHRDDLAWFDLRAMDVTVNLRQMGRLGLLDTPLPVLAHEVGHHVLAPADRTTSTKIVARCAKGLVDRPRLAPVLGNIWSDTLINDRLHRARGLDMSGVYRAGSPVTDPMMRVWMRGFELLWRLPTGSLCGPDLDAETDADGLLLARHTRAFARDPVGGAGGFAALLRRWIPESASLAAQGHLCGEDRSQQGESAPDVATDDALDAPVVHPAMDPRVNPEAPYEDPEVVAAREAGRASGRGRTSGQGFGPARLAELYATLGTGRDAGADWYVARAQSHLVPFPTTYRPTGVEDEPQGWESWEVGDDLSDVDWLASVTRSPVVVPGQTTVQRVVDREPLTTPTSVPVRLDLYVDSSGSMPDPRATPSPSVLAGTVLALSALRAGAAVQVTVWASPQQVARTDGGFTRDRDAVVGTLLHYWGGGTVFPLRDLQRDHPPRTRPRPPWEPNTHICVISDWGVTSMFGAYQPDDLVGVAAAALESAGGGGSLVLREPESVCDRVRAEAGAYVVYAVPEESDLVPFAARFARERWGRSQQTADSAVPVGRSGWRAS
ncbi:hypothetical protein [Lapillicoccus sp.]|uniref:hypothetical protein n=1 Tax=Lapillicoccus sp. TaxID=1909287 RepID=UPI0025F7D83E|nr:hypothetical protein [Lapillicoccus sp.]